MNRAPDLQVLIQRTTQFGYQVHMVIALPGVTRANAAEFAQTCKFHLGTPIIVLEKSNGFYDRIYSDVSPQELESLHINPDEFGVYHSSSEGFPEAAIKRWPPG